MQVSKFSALELKVPPVVVLIITVAGMYLTNYVISFEPLFTPWHIVISRILMMLAVCVGVAAVVSFSLAKTSLDPVNIDKAKHLVTSGIFRVSRNPMYLAMLLLTIAFAIRLQNPIAACWVLGFQLYMTRFQIGAEERMLGKVFGQAYSDYTSRVRRWI
ncbi:isoprenylcysteine carboxylmethyltransferase family protein [Glaciecola sp. XM2]|jgi:protein-S-isoprenylcysteine O-methyltransferase Ste14|uniref:methyltransferase family protein n=1 Tax=Glaciecola sp. XM2 TaxID=1914931 RepID=UPI001BDEE3D1|nr:isoprenylcysteine carboxylmethyltransferase family protein [Glaciecola sp. XM2]MBT1451797.1 isoprenylcysteine carboxylmethyltransferase family protein [Glaciecola sp. XM2]